MVNDYISLNNEDIIQISNNNYKSLNNNEIYNIKKVIYKDIVNSCKPYEHWLLKEIMEQPEKLKAYKLLEEYMEKDKIRWS